MAFTTRQMVPTVITQTKPVHVTVAGHGLSNGQFIRCTKFYQYPLADATGMYQLNNRSFQVQACTANTFDLYDEFGNAIDGTGFDAFISNGLAQMTLTGPDLDVENHIA